MYLIYNGKIIDGETAFISVNNRSFRYGDGFFETMQYKNGYLQLATYHFERLAKTAHALQFKLPEYFTEYFFAAQINNLVKENGIEKMARLRLTFFAGNGSLYDFENRNAEWVLQAWPIAPNLQGNKADTIKTTLYPNGFKAADSLANFKTNNFLLYSQAAIFAGKNNCEDAVVLNHKNTIADTTIANLFVVNDNEVITPGLEDGPVAGVMRRFLLQELPKYGFNVKEQSITIEQLLQSQTVFLSNAMGIRWVGSFEHVQYKSNTAGFIRQAIQQMGVG